VALALVLRGWPELWRGDTPTPAAKREAGEETAPRRGR
jgi:hypothetical protein